MVSLTARAAAEGNMNHGVVVGGWMKGCDSGAVSGITKLVQEEERWIEVIGFSGSGDDVTLRYIMVYHPFEGCANGCGCRCDHRRSKLVVVYLAVGWIGVLGERILVQEREGGRRKGGKAEEIGE